MKKILITGSTGFIGANLARSFIDDGERVSIIVRDKRLNWRLKNIPSGLKIYESDILNPKLPEVIKKISPDFVFHLAAYGVMAEESDTLRMFEANIRGTINLVSSLRELNIKKLINIGSAVEYGVKNKKIKEKDLLEPINDYGVTKAGSTLYCQKEGVRNNIPVVTFRLFTPYGYYEDKSRLIPSVILNALGNNPIPVSVPSSVRDFVFIEDVIDVLKRAMKKEINSGEIINVGFGKQQSVGNIVKLVTKLTKTRSTVRWGAVKPQNRFVEPKRLEADITKAEKILDWKPKYTIEEGIKKTIDWFSANRILYE